MTETRRLDTQTALRVVRMFKNANGRLSIRQLALLTDQPFNRVRIEIARARLRGELGPKPQPNPLVNFIRDRIFKQPISAIAGQLGIDGQSVADIIAIHDIPTPLSLGIPAPRVATKGWPKITANSNLKASWGQGFGKFNLISKGEAHGTASPPSQRPQGQAQTVPRSHTAGLSESR